MELLEHYLSLSIKAIFVENILLAYFLGMCTYLAVSKKVETAIGLTFAVIFISGITVPANWFIKNYLLDSGALKWTNIAGIEEITPGKNSLTTVLLNPTVSKLQPPL